MPRRARSTWSPTVTSPGAVIRPVAAEEQAALAGEPVDGDRVVPVVGGLVPDPAGHRRPVGMHHATAPAMPGIRRPSASRSAARIIILDGTQPQYGHSPPTSRASTPATARPASASALGGVLAAWAHADDDDVHRRARSYRPPPRVHRAAGPRVWQAGNVSGGIAAAGIRFLRRGRSDTRPRTGHDTMTSERGDDCLPGWPAAHRARRRGARPRDLLQDRPARAGRGRTGMAGLRRPRPGSAR